MNKNPKSLEYVAILFGVVAIMIALREVFIEQFIDLALEPMYAESEELKRARLLRKAGPYMFSSIGMVFGYYYSIKQRKKSVGLIICATVFFVLLLSMIA